MRKGFKGWMLFNMWLFNSRFAVWGEGMVQGLIFSLIALGMWRVVLD